MLIKAPITFGTIIKRYKRFLADIKLDSGEIITAHVANTGSMRSCWEEGWKVVLSFHDNPKRKLKYSLEMLNNGQSWIGVNTSLPNKLAIEAIRDNLILEIPHDCYIKPEYKIGNSRLDLYLEYNNIKHFIEIKNVTLKENESEQIASFPDSVTIRGHKHLNELIELVDQGYKCSMLFIIQREDINHFTFATTIDPEYSRLAKKAYIKGVQILVYGCKLTPEEIKITNPITYSL